MILAACHTDPTGPADGPDTVRERVGALTQLDVSATQSTGSIVAAHYTMNAWASQAVTLSVEAGHFAVTADRAGQLTMSSFELALAPIDIPANVLGHAAQVTNLRLALADPAQLATTWADDDDASVTAKLAVQLSWSLSVDGTQLPLGDPNLPPIPVTIDVTGDGAHVTAGVAATAAGDLWTWADLVKLSDLSLTLVAASD